MLTEILLSVIFLCFYWMYPKKPKKLPPGKWGWPVLGALPSSETNFVDEVQQLRKTHGDIISWRIGSRLHVFLSDYKTIKSVFSKPEASARAQMFTFQSLSRFTGQGIFAQSGHQWMKNRRFSLQQLKDLGMGKTCLSETIEQEAGILVEDFREYTNRPTKPPLSISVAVANIMWKMVADIRFDISNPKIKQFLKESSDVLPKMDGKMKWLDTFQWLDDYLPVSIKDKLGFMELYKLSLNFSNFFTDVINDHMKNQGEENSKDFVNAYLSEMNKPNSKLAGKDEEESIENLKILLHEFFAFGGNETTASTIRWALYYLAKHQDVQAKVQEEIDAVVPKRSLPSLELKNKMPYTNATVYEVMRLASSFPLGFPHEATEDIEVDGYIIPKNSLIYGNAASSHQDPKYWEKPTEFYPEHFLDDEGNLLNKKEGFIPFSIGRRQCIGESLARMELFIFLSSLLKTFAFSFPEGQKLIMEANSDDRLFTRPPDFDIVIRERRMLTRPLRG